MFSSCLGYTFQILAQRGGDPALVSLLLSLESLFAAVFGAVLLGERMSAHELVGCALMIAAIVIAELPARSARAKKRSIKPENNILQERITENGCF